MLRRASLFILLACVACDKDQKAQELAQKVAPSTSSAPATPSASPAASASAEAAAGDGGKAAPASSMAMPERPIPRPQATVSAGMPVDVQMKAIQYMVAMRSPRPDEASSDPTFAADLATKLKPIVLGMDKGADKARLNRVEVVANGRQVDLLMAGGCDDRTPQRAVQNAGFTSATLVTHGVLVVRCNDAHYQCLQSMRDPDDVLCTTAPRHK